MIYWFAVTIGYLCVGFAIARLVNERLYRSEGLGKDGYGNVNTIQGAQYRAWWRGLAITIFWPVLAILGGIGGFCFGLYLILKHVYVPGPLRARELEGADK